MEHTQPKPAMKKRKISGNKPQVKWPGASEKTQRETINRDLTSVLQGMSGTVERKRNNTGDILYSDRAELYGGMEQARKSTSTRDQVQTDKGRLAD